MRKYVQYYCQYCLLIAVSSESAEWFLSVPVDHFWSIRYHSKLSIAKGIWEKMCINLFTSYGVESGRTTMIEDTITQNTNTFQWDLGQISTDAFKGYANFSLLNWTAITTAFSETREWSLRQFPMPTMTTKLTSWQLCGFRTGDSHQWPQGLPYNDIIVTIFPATEMLHVAYWTYIESRGCAMLKMGMQKFSLWLQMTAKTWFKHVEAWTQWPISCIGYV